jgi:FixJ family two-component response regulator
MPKQPLISIVDDDPSVGEAIANLLRAAGFSARAYCCAEDFLQSPRRRRTACLIADLRMPGMTGLELHRHLMQSDRPIPTVLITAHADESLRAQALRAGVVCYLTKPFHEDDLLGCIRSALAHGRKEGKGP